nr:MAG TPA: hypothetical protein [Caudoviricetes sp.]
MITDEIKSATTNLKLSINRRSNHSAQNKAAGRFYSNTHSRPF